MRIFCMLSAMVFVLGAGCDKREAGSSEGTTDAEVSKMEESLIYYTCPMESHKHVHSGQPGKCPECQMALVRGVTTSVDSMEYYGCPMESHSHIRTGEPGTCPECPMALKPMRLDKSKV